MMTKHEQAYELRRARFRAQCDENAGSLRAFLASEEGRATVAVLDAQFTALRAQRSLDGAIR